LVAELTATHAWHDHVGHQQVDRSLILV